VATDYGRYIYQYSGTYQGTMAGLGGRLTARYTKKINDLLTVRALGDYSFLPLSGVNYGESIVWSETLSTLSGFAVTDNYSLFQRTGSKYSYDFKGLSGAGVVIQSAPSTQIGVAVKWHLSYNKTIYDLKDKSNSPAHDYDRDDINYSHHIILPLGFEYLFKNTFALRLGVTTDFIFTDYFAEENGVTQIDSSNTQMTNATTDFYDSYNLTSYSYGFGYRINRLAMLDVTGITNLVDISNLFVSLIIRY
jgi:hypothetical protein